MRCSQAIPGQQSRAGRRRAQRVFDERRRRVASVHAFRQRAPPRTCSRAAIEESEHVTRDRAQWRARCDLTFRILAHAQDDVLDGRRLESIVIHGPMERGQQIGIVIGLAAEHHAIHVRELLRDLRYGAQAAICDDRECRELFFTRQTLA